MIFGISVILVVISSSFLFISFLSLSLVSLANDLSLFYLLKKLALGFIDLSIFLIYSLQRFIFNVSMLICIKSRKWKDHGKSNGIFKAFF